MHRYLRSLYVEIEEPYFGVLVQRDVDNEEEFIMLGADILRAASMFSYESKLYITYIYIVSPGPNNSSVTLYLNGYDVISDTAEGKVNIYDVMEVEVDYGDS